MKRSDRAPVKQSTHLSLLLGVLLSAAHVFAQESEPGIPDDTTAPGITSNPDNLEADPEMLAVQQQMVSKALEYARELDFESAEQVLREASTVRETQELIEIAREEIAGFRMLRVEELRLAAESAIASMNFERVEHILIELIALGGADTTVDQLRRKMEVARLYGGFLPGQVIKDPFLNQDSWAPSLVVISSGSFKMGSPATEKGRMDNEGPQHRVTFSRGFALGQHEVAVSEFRDFVEQTGYTTDAERDRFSLVYEQRSGRLHRRDNVSWEMSYEGRKAEDDHPVVHVSWHDAQAYANWLAQGTGKSYRLPTEAEFEYAVRGGKSSRYWWGRGSPRGVVENITGEGDNSRNRRSWSNSFKGYTDHFWGPAPVGSFKPSPFGLFDIGGNVGEWVMDCWHDTYTRAPVDGSGWVNPGCKLRVIRGGYWASSPEQTRSAFRVSAKPNRHDARIGFRIARDL